MYCARLHKQIARAECPLLINATVDGALLRVCQACPAGRALMATVPRWDAENAEWALPAAALPPPTAQEPPPQNITEDTMSQDTASQDIASAAKTITLRELSEHSGVEYTSVCGIFRGKTKSGINKMKLDAWMSANGYAWADVTMLKGKKAGVTRPVKIAPATDMAAPVAVVQPGEIFEEILSGGEWTPEDPPAPSYAQSVLNKLSWQAVDKPTADLGNVPLEALVAEITRRMPRAEVVLR